MIFWISKKMSFLTVSGMERKICLKIIKNLSLAKDIWWILKNQKILITSWVFGMSYGKIILPYILKSENKQLVSPTLVNPLNHQNMRNNFLNFYKKKQINLPKNMLHKLIYITCEFEEISSKNIIINRFIWFQLLHALVYYVVIVVVS